MEKLYFSCNKLLDNLVITQIIDGEYPIMVKLINNKVKILLIVEDENNIVLYGYYNLEKKKGIARCALYFLLIQLLNKDVIISTQNVNVSSPNPDDGNMKRLIKIYKQIGFTLSKPKPGKPINLNSSVQTLIESLEKQCCNGFTEDKK